jgi:arginase
LKVFNDMRLIQRICLVCIFYSVAPLLPAHAQDHNLVWDKTQLSAQSIGVVMQPYTARRGDDEVSIAPDLLMPEVAEVLREMNIDLASKNSIDLTDEEKKQYGVWHRLGLADAHLGRAVAPLVGDGVFTLGLLGNCNSSLGMLAGLQHSGPDGAPLKVGLIWIDAHGDFNTPETTLSGWLGGMPVSVASGQCLSRLRLKTGLDPAVLTENIIMMGQRDVDPLEQELIDQSDITSISAQEMLGKSPAMLEGLDRLSAQVDVIYLHIDLDILDASEIPGSFFEVMGGPTAAQLQVPVRHIMQNPKVKALGLSSFPTAEQGRETSMESAMTILRAALAGLEARNQK